MTDSTHALKVLSDLVHDLECGEMFLEDIPEALRSRLRALLKQPSRAKQAAKPTGSALPVAAGVALRPFDPAAHLHSEEDAGYYLEASTEGNDARHIAGALEDVARFRSRK